MTLDLQRKLKETVPASAWRPLKVETEDFHLPVIQTCSGMSADDA